MVDIAAQLSLTPSSKISDSTAILGAETADSQAFGEILAGRVAGQVEASVDSAAAAGNRQPSGKILPVAAQLLPEAAPADCAAQIDPALTAPVETTPAQAVAAALSARLAASASTLIAGTSEAVLPETIVPEQAPSETDMAKAAEASPVHSLIKSLAAVIRGQAKQAEDAPIVSEDGEASAAGIAAGTGDQPSLLAAQDPVAVIALPLVQSVASQPIVPQPIVPQPIVPQPAIAAEPVQAQPDPDEAARDPAIQNPPAVRVAAVTAEAPVIRNLTVPAVSAEAPVPVVTLTPDQARVAGNVVTARVEVVATDTAEVVPHGTDRRAGNPLAERAAAAERPLTASTLAIADNQSQPAVAGSAAPFGTAPTLEMPRQDFAALIERLIEVRNASASQSTHASVTHAEFGQVSLHFQQDGSDLKVGMSSADPDFAVAVQAAMPAERQNLNADTRGQSQGQSSNQSQGQSQSAGTSSNSNHETAGQRSGDAADQQGNRQGRGGRGNTSPANPSQRWTGSDQPQSRGGIFA